MFLRKILPALALFGIVFGVYFAFAYGRAEELKPNQLSLPPSAPFDNTVSGTGVIEANSRNIEVGSYLSGVVTHVAVVEGDWVKASAPLFQLDDGIARADVDAKTKEIAAAESRLTNARVTLADEKEQLRRYEKLSDGGAVSKNDVIRHRYAAERASSVIETAAAELESAKAQLHSAKVTLEHLTVRAPVAGRIFKVRIRPGEYVTSGAGDAPILMGNDKPLYLRVTIDENDLWRFNAKAKATAALRSNKDIRVPLKFVRVEPYVLPKRNLNGDTTERIDTRVLEVLYAIENTDKPLYIGQQMDVFVEAEK